MPAPRLGPGDEAVQERDCRVTTATSSIPHGGSLRGRPVRLRSVLCCHILLMYQGWSLMLPLR